MPIPARQELKLQDQFDRLLAKKLLPADIEAANRISELNGPQSGFDITCLTDTAKYGGQRVAEGILIAYQDTHLGMESITLYRDGGAIASLAIEQGQIIFIHAINPVSKTSHSATPEGTITGETEIIDSEQRKVLELLRENTK